MMKAQLPLGDVTETVFIFSSSPNPSMMSSPFSISTSPIIREEKDNNTSINTNTSDPNSPSTPSFSSSKPSTPSLSKPATSTPSTRTGSRPTASASSSSSSKRRSSSPPASRPTTQSQSSVPSTPSPTLNTLSVSSTILLSPASPTTSSSRRLSTSSTISSSRVPSSPEGSRQGSRQSTASGIRPGSKGEKRNGTSGGGARRSGSSKKKKGKGSKKKKKKKPIIENPKLVREALSFVDSNSLDSLRALVDSPESDQKWDLQQGAGEWLIRACQLGHVDVLVYLLGLGGIDVNVANGKALQRACLFGRLACVRLLLDAGADVQKKAPFTDYTCMHYACQSSTFPLSSLPSSSSSSSTSSSSTALSSSTSTSSSSSTDSLALFHVLLSYGGRIDSLSHPEHCAQFNGWSPLHFAADNGSDEMVTAIVEKSKEAERERERMMKEKEAAAAAAANVNTNTGIDLSNPSSNSNSNPILTSSSSSSSPIPSSNTLSLGLDGLPTSSTPSTSRFLAATSGFSSPLASPLPLSSSKRISSGKLKSSKKSDSDSSFISPNGYFPLDTPSASGDTALSIAAERGHWHVVRQLVLAGCDLHALRRGLTPTQWAVYRAEGEALEWLVAYGGVADLEVRCVWFNESKVVREAIKEVEEKKQKAFLAALQVKEKLAPGSKPPIDIKTLVGIDGPRPNSAESIAALVHSGAILTLRELIAFEFSETVYDELDLCIYRGTLKIREREAKRKLLSEVAWMYMPVYDPYSFDALPAPTIRTFPEHIVAMISGYDM